MFLNLVIFICLALFGCSDPRSEREKLRDLTLNQLAKEMQKKNLYAVGSGGGCTRDKKINLISIVFHYKQVLSIETARKLMVESADTLLTLINSNPSSKEYFEVFPPPVDVICICITGITPSPENASEIRGILLIKGKLYYNVEDKSPLPRPGPVLMVHEETYEEAKNILSNEH